MSILDRAKRDLTTTHADSETDDQHPYGGPRHTRAASNAEDAPRLDHRMRHDRSILAIALSDKYIYAGTQAGEILVFTFDTSERIAVIEGHRGLSLIHI